MTTAGQNQSAGLATSEIGTVLAHRYEVVRELGRGGMGVVYLCKDIVTGDRVALKRLRSPEKGETRAEESWWFHQEARAVALLDHPAIVRARDFGQLVDGSPFFVMDVLPGRSVHEWMHTMHLPWNVIWAMVDQVLAALAHAHARGVIHGDLKPSNIMLDLASTTLGPRAFVLDLGLAWLREYRHDSRLDGVTRPRGGGPLRRGHGGMGRARADSPPGVARRSRDRSLRARLRHVPRPGGAGGLRGQRAGRAPRPQANAGPAADARARTCRRRRASSSCASSRRSRGIASSSRPTRGARGSASGRRTRRRSRRSCRACRALTRRRWATPARSRRAS